MSEMELGRQFLLSQSDWTGIGASRLRDPPESMPQLLSQRISDRFVLPKPSQMPLLNRSHKPFDTHPSPISARTHSEAQSLRSSPLRSLDSEVSQGSHPSSRDCLEWLDSSPSGSAQAEDSGYGFSTPSPHAPASHASVEHEPSFEFHLWPLPGSGDDRRESANLLTRGTQKLKEPADDVLEDNKSRLVEALGDHEEGGRNDQLSHNDAISEPVVEDSQQMISPKAAESEAQVMMDLQEKMNAAEERLKERMRDALKNRKCAGERRIGS